MALVVGRGGRAVRRVHGGPSIRPRAPVSQQLLALPRESPDVTAVERDAAKLGLRCAVVAGWPSKNCGLL